MSNKKRLKIVHFSQFLGIGGLEKIILELALKQKELGHEVTIVVYDFEQAWVEFFREKGLRVITDFSKKEGFDKGLIAQFSTFINQERFNIIQSHDINPLIYLSAAKIQSQFKRGESFKLIHTSHTLDHVENSKKVEFFERMISHFADQIITVSPKIKNFYLKKALLAPEKVHLIENGISQKAFSFEETKKMREKFFEEFSFKKELPLGLSLSRVVPLKDQEFLINQIKERPDLQLAVVGPASDPAYFQKLQKIVEDIPFQNIRLIGPRADVLELNNLSDFYLSASTHEGLPVSVLEAMSVGTPCLVTDIPGHQILNKYGDVVETYKRGDIKNFNQKLDIILKDLKSSKYEKGKTIVDRYFSTNRMVSKYDEVYRL